MLYPEERVHWCDRCRCEIPIHCVWRAMGWEIDRAGRKRRTRVLFGRCPQCGRQEQVALGGGFLSQWFYAWLWKQRYPSTRPPDLEPVPATAGPLPASESPVPESPTARPAPLARDGSPRRRRRRIAMG